jgi:23S rRNA (adenine2503-C2)-methyltransferase
MKSNTIWSLEPLELENILIAAGEKKYRSDQVLNWIYRQNIIDEDKMSNLSLSTRKLMQEKFSPALPKISQIDLSNDGTRKFLLELEDSNYIEMVLIPAGEKLTLCISSQVGCLRNCSFCATAKIGLIRNLSAGEINSQVYLAQQLATPQKITNFVFMGMGEPLDNLDNVIKSIRILNNEKCFAISPRRITVSTCGVIPQIKKLGESGLKVKLAVSLNSAIDEKRTQIMPVNKKYPLPLLKSALLNYTKITPFRITFEYVMIKNFNISFKDQKALAKFTGDISSKINLIPWNPIPETGWKSPNQAEIDQFIAGLYKISNVPVTLRNSRGKDIMAACGMLAGKNQHAQPADRTP